MGYNIHDLNNGLDKIQESLDRRSQEKGEELANKIIHGNLLTLMFVRWANFLFLSFTITAILSTFFHINEVISGFIAIIAAIFIVRLHFFWYMKLRYVFLIIVVISILLNIQI